MSFAISSTLYIYIYIYICVYEKRNTSDCLAFKNFTWFTFSIEVGSKYPARYLVVVSEILYFQVSFQSSKNFPELVGSLGGIFLMQSRDLDNKEINGIQRSCNFPLKIQTRI